MSRAVRRQQWNQSSLSFVVFAMLPFLMLILLLSSGCSDAIKPLTAAEKHAYFFQLDKQTLAMQLVQEAYFEAARKKPGLDKLPEKIPTEPHADADFDALLQDIRKQVGERVCVVEGEWRYFSRFAASIITNLLNPSIPDKSLTITTDQKKLGSLSTTLQPVTSQCMIEVSVHARSGAKSSGLGELSLLVDIRDAKAVELTGVKKMEYTLKLSSDPEEDRRVNLNGSGIFTFSDDSQMTRLLSGYDTPDVLKININDVSPLFNAEVEYVWTRSGNRIKLNGEKVILGRSLIFPLTTDTAGSEYNR